MNEILQVEISIGSRVIFKAVNVLVELCRGIGGSLSFYRGICSRVFNEEVVSLAILDLGLDYMVLVVLL